LIGALCWKIWAPTIAVRGLEFDSGSWFSVSTTPFRVLEMTLFNSVGVASSLIRIPVSRSTWLSTLFWFTIGDSTFPGPPICTIFAAP